MNTSKMLQVYSSLLADVSESSGFSEIRGLEVNLQWCLKDAPQLEKLMLSAFEGLTKNEVVFAATPRALLNLMCSCLNGKASSVRYMRQLLLFCYKAEVTHDSKTTAEAFASFLKTNNEMLAWEPNGSRAWQIIKRAKRHVQSVLHICEFDEIIPSNGPGATTTPKGPWTHWFSKIESVYPQYPWFALLSECMAGGTADRLTEHIKARVTAVPKDSRGPRLISVHPACSIWIQQGVRRCLEQAIVQHRNNKQGRHWPQGHVRFADQTVNGRIALLSSKSRRYATLDLSEASDRVSLQLVRILFGRYYKYFDCCRADQYDVNGSTYDVGCYAPMGNATVFPVESLVFWSICVASLEACGAKAPNAVYVFGDDLALPTKYAPQVIKDLESCGFRVNRGKSFISGFFRESCGVDAFNGFDVTPLRWKTVMNPRTACELMSVSDLAMRLRLAGYRLTSACLYHQLRETLWSRHRKVLGKTNNPDHGSIAEFTECDSSVWAEAHWSKRYHWWYTRNVGIEEVVPKDSPHGWYHVLESLTKLERRKSPELGRVGKLTHRPEHALRRVRLTRKWTAIL